MTHDQEIKIKLEISNIELTNKKLMQDTAFLEKKNATYMFTIILAVFAIGIGFAKLFL